MSLGRRMSLDLDRSVFKFISFVIDVFVSFKYNDIIGLHGPFLSIITGSESNISVIDSMSGLSNCLGHPSLQCCL